MSWEFSGLALPKEPCTYQYKKIRHWTSFLIILYLTTSSLLGIFKDFLPFFYFLLFFIPLLIWAIVFAISYILNTSYEAKISAINEINNKKNENMKKWIKHEVWFYFSDVIFAKNVNIADIKRNFNASFQQNKFKKITNSLDEFLANAISTLSLSFQDKNIEFHLSGTDENLLKMVKKTLDEYIDSNFLKNWKYSSTKDWEISLENIFNSSIFHVFFDIRGHNSSSLNESISWFVCSNAKLGQDNDLFPSLKLLRPNVIDSKMTKLDQLFQVIREQLESHNYELWLDDEEQCLELLSGIFDKEPSFAIDKNLHKWSVVNGSDDCYNYINFFSLMNECCRENNILITKRAIYAIKV